MARPGLVGLQIYLIYLLSNIFSSALAIISFKCIIKIIKAATLKSIAQAPIEQHPNTYFTAGRGGGNQSKLTARYIIEANAIAVDVEWTVAGKDRQLTARVHVYVCECVCVH